MKVALSCIASLTLVLISTNGQAHAAVIYTNPIAGGNPNTANPYTAGETVAPNLAGLGIGRGAGAVGTNANDRYNANSWNTATLDTTAYFDWTLTPSAGFGIDFTSLTGNWQRSSTGPSSYSLRSSLDGFASDIETGAITGSGSAVAYSLDLSGAALNAIASPITFRLYAWGTTNSGGTFSVNDFSFDGAVAALVPEPNSTCLILLAATTLLGLRRVSA